MKNFDFNKLFMAVLSAVLIASLAGFVSEYVVHPEKPEKNSFEVAVAEEAQAGGAAAPAAPQGPGPIDALLASADVATGQKLARACQVCHSFEKGGPNKVGPNLWAIVGAPHAHAAGFAYSKAFDGMKDKPWTYDELNKFLYNPKAYAPGTKMAYAGLKKDDERAALIAWMRTLADSPVALPK